MKHGFIGSDTHCGHKVGLTHKSWHYKPPKEAPHQIVKQHQQRQELWNWFEKEVKSCDKFDWALHNGDLVEGKGSRSEGVELLTASRDEQAEMAIEVIKTINAKRNDFIYGTPYHTGQGEDFEDRVAKEFSSGIQAEGHFDIEGLIVVAKHYIGNSSSPVSGATAIKSAMVKQLLWSEIGQQPKANLIIRSHIHRCISVSEPQRNQAGWVTPALQGLGSRYGARQCDGVPVTFGFLELFVKSKTDWGIKAHICPLSLQKATVIKV
jgi:hypothetical protein